MVMVVLLFVYKREVALFNEKKQPIIYYENKL